MERHLYVGHIKKLCKLFNAIGDYVRLTVAENAVVETSDDETAISEAE